MREKREVEIEERREYRAKNVYKEDIDKGEERTRGIGREELTGEGRAKIKEREVESEGIREERAKNVHRKG